MSADELDQLSQQVMTVMIACATPGQAIEDSWVVEDFSCRWKYLANQSCAYLVTDEGGLVAFIIYRIERRHGRNCVTLLSAFVRPEYQGQGIAFALNARIVFRLLARRPWARAMAVGFVANPIAYVGWRSRITVPRFFYPQVDDPAVSSHLGELARAYVERELPGASFDPSTGVVRERSAPRSPIPGASGDEVVDEFFRSKVNDETGDAVIMLIDGSRRMILTEIAEILRAVWRAFHLGMRSKQRGAE